MRLCINNILLATHVEASHALAKNACAILEHPIGFWNSSFVMWYAQGTASYGIRIPFASLLALFPVGPAFVTPEHARHVTVHCAISTRSEALTILYRTRDRK
jgi:hypothetical protein